MIDRSRKPDRRGLSSGAVLPDSPREATSGPRHPVSPPTIDGSETDHRREPTDRPGPTGDDGADGLARTLRDLIQSLPRRTVESARGTIESTPDAIIGPATPTFEDQSSVERRVEAEDGVGRSDSDSAISGRFGPPAPGGHEDPPARSDSGGSDRREEIATFPLSTMLYGSAHEEPAESLIANRRDPNEGPIADPAFSVDRAGSVEASGAWTAESTHPPVSDTSGGGLAAAAIAGNVEFYTDPGRWTSRPRWAAPELTMRGVASSIRMPPETVAIGQVGPAGRHDEGFDRTSGDSRSATSWSGLLGVDPPGSRAGAVSLADEGSAGVDLSPTNALLGQILDELRRHQQSAPIASGRLVYPER